MSARAACGDEMDAGWAVQGWAGAGWAGGAQDGEGLLTLVAGCANPGVSRRALLVRTRALPSTLARPPLMRVVVAALDPVLALDRAQGFLLEDGTLVACWRGGAETDAVAGVAMAQLRSLLAGLDGCTVERLELPRDSDALSDAVAACRRTVAPAPAADGPGMDATMLQRLEEALAQADVAAFVRRKPVCAWPAGGAPALQWERRGLAVAALAAALAPGVRLRGDPWLFRRLTRSFDRRMLALLSDPRELRHAGPFALDLNVANITGPEFLRFDTQLPPGLRGEVVLCVLPGDVLAYTEDFAFARDFAHARGYRLMMRQMTPMLLAVMPPALSGVDLVELLVPGGDDAMPMPAFDVAPERVVLGGVDSAAALRWGQARGLRLFEGGHVRAALAG